MPSDDTESRDHPSLRQFIERIMEERDRLYTERIGRIAGETERELKALHIRIESLNVNPVFTRAEHEAYQKQVDADLRILRESRAELAGKASQSQMNITFVVAIVSVLISLGSFIIHTLAVTNK